MRKDNNLPVLNHRGYLGYLYVNEKDRNRIYGSIVREGDSDKVLAVCAGDNIDKVTRTFIVFVESIISDEEFLAQNRIWKEKTDWRSIAAVFNMLPDAFENRIISGAFDEKLLEAVPGGNYVVPLYYVTKAWEFLLKGSLASYSFMVSPDEEDGEVSDDYVNYKGMKRLRDEAIRQNDLMKSVWKKYYGVDVDKLAFHPSNYNMHMVPNVSMDEYYDFFSSVPDGVAEWIFNHVNFPDREWITFDAVSALMEFCCFMLDDRLSEDKV